MSSSQGVPLGDLIAKASKVRAHHHDQDLPVMSMTIDRGLVEQSTQFKKRIASRETEQYLVVEPGQMVVGLHPDEGAIGFHLGDQVGIVSPAYRIWNLSAPKHVDRRYLNRYLKSPRALSYYDSVMTGTAHRRRRLSDQSIQEMQVPLPSLGEQRRIAWILDEADALRAKRRRTLELLDDLTQSIFLDMFGATEPDGRIEDVAAPGKGSMRTGPFGSQLLHSEFVDSGVAVLGIDNAVSNRFAWGARRFITERKYQELKRYTVRPGDVLITIMGTNGRCAVVPQDVPTAINTKHLCCITPDAEKILSEYLWAYFLFHPSARSYLRSSTKGAIMGGLNMGIIKSMPLHLPSLKAQGEFVARLHLAERQAADLEMSRNRLDELFSSLQSRAFSGAL